MYPDYTPKDIERFWSKVEKTDNPNDCWLWTASLARKHYGQFGVQGRNLRAHKVAWELTYGKVSDGLHVLHDCDNPQCVNPAHLWLGTNQDNMKDRDQKGRQITPKGAQNGKSVLTNAMVDEIRRRYATSRITYNQLAREYNVSKSTIGGVLQHRAYK